MIVTVVRSACLLLGVYRPPAGGQRRRDRQAVVADGMQNGQAARVQRDRRVARIRRWRFDEARYGAVLRVSDDRPAVLWRLQANLMRPTGKRVELQQPPFCIFSVKMQMQ